MCLALVCDICYCYRMMQAVLEKLNTIDRDLQKLKVDLLLNGKIRKQVSGFYQEKNILQETRKIRKQMWNETFKKHL